MSDMLIAGIGNVFFGDDGFGVEVIARLRERALPCDACIRDVGIRGIDLVYALQDCEVAVLVDTVSRGNAPGTLYLIEADEPAADPESTPVMAAHALDPFEAVRIARSQGARARVFVVGCEPESFGTEHGQQGRMGLSATVAAAVDRAADIVEEFCAEWTTPNAATALADDIHGNSKREESQHGTIR